ncbi:hypothetical protein HZA33_03360 [Candidatus Pacearchaeota archaeon]|nr:hypothetical protein [Candidatus Pacearchaeota archaeon]
MNLEQKFNQLIEQWKKEIDEGNVLIYSSPHPLLNCPAYKEIIALGPHVLLFIRRFYDSPEKDITTETIKGHGLLSAVIEIAGEDFSSSIPCHLRGRIDELEEHTKKWLDNNMKKYFGGS